MAEEAESDGTIKPGDTLIEVSSGNTRIAIALMAAIKGYKCIITLSEKMSLEKEQILKALGAKVVRTPAGVPIDSPGSIISVTQPLQKEIPNSFILNQYTNPENPAAQRRSCGTRQKGISMCQSAELVPGASLQAQQWVLRNTARVSYELDNLKAEYKVEGIGYDFAPKVLNQTEPDLWIKTSDRDSFQYARGLVREEGLLCRGSSGATIAALAQLVEARPELNTEDKHIVVMLPSS
ncbi:unnamed protein product [Penicillium egyptiacum]|uniref:cystathionine beta-synthase n=1 Tax=Penicillium egyptiacum TaxID=1303716 RepID=A0A9W4P7X8_9EURO|nr:unnamed protein product [Penicillium egyptiacum]